MFIIILNWTELTAVLPTYLPGMKICDILQALYFTDL
jgi:hypothetical protein